MRRVIHSIPEGPYDCELVSIETQVIPIVNFALRLVLNPTYYASEADWLRGEQLIRRFQVALLCGGMQELVESNKQIYRLLDTALFNRVYIDNAGVIEPAIPTVPPDPANEPYANLWTTASVVIQMRDKITALEETVRLMTSQLSGNDSYAYPGVTLYDILQAIQAPQTQPATIGAIESVYRLLDTLINATQYSVDNNGVPVPAIPLIPPTQTATLISRINNMATQQTTTNQRLQLMINPADNQGVYTNFYSIVAAIQALTNLIGSNQGSNLDYTEVLDRMDFKLGLIGASSNQGQNFILRQLCCELAGVEPLPLPVGRPDEYYLCQGLQKIVDALGSTLDSLSRYVSENQYVDATGVSLIVNRDFAFFGLPSVSQQTVTELVKRVQDLGSGYGGVSGQIQANKNNIISAVFGSIDPGQARNNYIAYTSAKAEEMQYEVWKMAEVLGRDQAIWNVLFNNQIDASEYDGSLCNGAGGGNPPQTFYAVEGLLVDTNDMSEIPGYHHYYLEISGGSGSYLGSPSWAPVSNFDTRALYRSATYTGGLNNPHLFGYFESDWGGVQLKILDGPDDVSVVFYPNEGEQAIGLSKTSYTTLPPGTTNFFVLAPSDDHPPYFQFTLSIIFP